MARVALAKLRSIRFTAQISLRTYGTPHRGTPLVAGGKGLLSQLYKIGEWGVNVAAPVLSPLTWGHGLLFDAPTLPTGIAEMAEDSSVLLHMNYLDDPTDVTCVGSNFDVHGSGSGFAVEIEGVLRGYMHDIRHDLVVPESSATGFGTPQPPSPLTCSHLQYFLQSQVQQDLWGLFDAPASRAAAPAASSHGDGPSVDSGAAAAGALQAISSQGPAAGGSEPKKSRVEAFGEKVAGRKKVTIRNPK